MKTYNFSKFLEYQGQNLKRLGFLVTAVLVAFCALMPTVSNELEKRKAAEAENAAPAIVIQSENAKDNVKDIQADTAEKTAVKTAESTKPKNEDKSAENKAAEVSTSLPGINDIIWPAQGAIIQGVGINYSRTYSDYRYHNGIDIKVKRGTEVLAALGGKVIKVETSKADGKKVIIEHTAGWQSSYCQLEEVYVKTGDTVATGKKLGMVGQPGLNEIMDEPHLHFVLLKEGKVADPQDYLPK